MDNSTRREISYYKLLSRDSVRLNKSHALSGIFTEYQGFRKVRLKTNLPNENKNTARTF